MGHCLIGQPTTSALSYQAGVAETILVTGTCTPTDVCPGRKRFSEPTE